MDIDDPILSALEQYDAELLTAVGSKLFRPRIGQPADELIERIVSTQKNPPVIDRLLKQLPAECRHLIAAIGRTRQTRWRNDELITLAMSFGAGEGFPVIAGLLDHGLLVVQSSGPVPSFNVWFCEVGVNGQVLIPPSVLVRAAAMPWTGSGHVQTVDVAKATSTSDGLDWPLRLALARQLVRALPVKLTQTGALYKRDLTRFTADAVLLTPFESGAAPVDSGLLALTWARAAKLLKYDDELKADKWPEAWSQPIQALIADLFTALFGIRDWDPLKGHRPEEPSATNTAGLVLLLRLAEEPNAFQPLSALAEWLWENHPHWSGLLPKDSAVSRGRPWVEAWFAATVMPLGLVESAALADAPAYRLTDLGRHLLACGPAPAEAAAFPKTLLVQPNGEILVYRQGLSPDLAAKLTQFATWKRIGSACTLELNAPSLTSGLEDGLTLAEVLQALDRHGMKPIPANVTDLLRRWTDRRERLVVYPSATLVEFLLPADLDEAITRGIVSVRLTDRVGLTADGKSPDFQFLRLLGNRDYEAKPQACVVAEDDGVTLRVDATTSDLLLDAEIGRFAEPLPGVNGDGRRYRMSPATLRAAVAQGHSIESLQEWFMARSGEGLPAAARLFLVPARTALRAARLLVIEAPTAEIADGIEQWPQTAGFVVKRIGPMAMVVEERDVAELNRRLGTLGIGVERSEDFEHLDGRLAAGKDHA